MRKHAFLNLGETQRAGSGDVAAVSSGVRSSAQSKVKGENHVRVLHEKHLSSSIEGGRLATGLALYNAIRARRAGPAI